MIRRTLQGIAASLMLAGLAASQTSSKIVIGDGVISTGSLPAYTGSSDAPFQAAITALGGTASGTIEVMPGSYNFVNTVNVNVAGVRISGGPSARIAPRASLTSPCFLVTSTASDFVLDGVTLVDQRDAPPAEIAFLDVRAPRFTLTNCRVLVSNFNAPTTASGRSRAIKISGTLGDELFGCLIQATAFVVGRPAPQVPGPLVPVEAPGRVLVHSENGRNLRILGNTFQSGVVPTVMSVASVISLVDEEWSSITGNTFSYLETPLGGVPEDDALVSSKGVGESNHLVVSANYFERCGGESIVAVRGHGFVTINGNGFGRLWAGDSGAVYLAGGSGNVVSANNFHNVGAATTPSIRAVMGAAPASPAEGLVISSNAFSLADGEQVVIESVNGVLVEGNQFIGPTGSDPHLRLEDVSGASITGNRFTCVSSAAIQLNAPAAKTAFLCGNILNPGACAGGLSSTTNYTLITCDMVGNPNF